jgi:hypothetical protein
MGCGLAAGFLRRSLMPVGGGRGWVRRRRMGDGFVDVCSFFARLRGWCSGSDAALSGLRPRLRLDRDEVVVFSAGRGKPVAL